MAGLSTDVLKTSCCASVSHGDCAWFLDLACDLAAALVCLGGGGRSLAGSQRPATPGWPGAGCGHYLAPGARPVKGRGGLHIGHMKGPPSGRRMGPLGRGR